MRLVIADTGPINYLILIGHIDILPALFERVILPNVVRDELFSCKAPSAVRAWIASIPDWIEVATVSGTDDAALQDIDLGERAAIRLAAALHADLLLMDDRKGVRAAEQKGLRVTGTLGVLDLAADRGLLDFAQAVQKLQRTNFRQPQALLEMLQEKHTKEK